MAHADQSRFKSTIIGPSFARAPESIPLEPVPEPAAPAHAVPPQSARPQTTVILRKDEMRQAPLAVRGGSHSMVMEAVTLPRKLDPRLVMLDGAASRQARAYRLL